MTSVTPEPSSAVFEQDSSTIITSANIHVVLISLYRSVYRRCPHIRGGFFVIMSKGICILYHFPMRTQQSFPMLTILLHQGGREREREREGRREREGEQDQLKYQSPTQTQLIVLTPHTRTSLIRLWHCPYNTQAIENPCTPTRYRQG